MSSTMQRMTLEEAAKLLGVTTATLRQQAKVRSLRAKKIGRDWWVTPAEVERYRRESLGRPGRKARKDDT